MGEKALLNRVNKIKELEKEVAELESLIDGLKDEIKTDLTQKGIDETKTGDYIIRYKEVISNRLDSKALKNELPDVYKKYSKESTTKRFSIA